MTAQPGKSATNTQRAVDALRDRIFSGALPAGSDHLEAELAETLGMSRTPVREALRVLEAQGLLVMRPRRGVRITALSAEDMAEIYDILTEIECLAAERAAERGLGRDDLHRLRQAVDAMDHAIAARDLDSWAEADARFHHELVRLGGNRRAETIAAVMSDQVRRARRITLHMRPLPLKSNEDHRAVCEAIEAGDPETARARHRTHRRAAKALLVGLLKTHRLTFV